MLYYQLLDFESEKTKERISVLVGPFNSRAKMFRWLDDPRLKEYVQKIFPGPMWVCIERKKKRLRLTGGKPIETQTRKTEGVIAPEKIALNIPAPSRSRA